MLASFFLWEYWLGRRPGGQPLVDLTLLRSGSFTWGVLLMSVLVLAMTGVLFTLPQFYQGVLGTDAMGSGLRLLPLVAGLIVWAARRSPGAACRGKDHGRAGVRGIRAGHVHRIEHDADVQ